MTKPVVVFLGTALAVSVVGGLAVTAIWYCIQPNEAAAPQLHDIAAAAPDATIAGDQRPPAPAEPVEPAAEVEQPTPTAASEIAGKTAVDPKAPAILMKLPFYLQGAAYDAKHGVLAAIANSDSKVYFLTIDELTMGFDEVKNFVELEGRPIAIAAKPTKDGPRFVAIQEGPNEMVVIDPTVPKVVQSIPLVTDENLPRSIAAGSSEDDPYVYLGASASVSRVNILQREPPTIWKGESHGLAAAADGKSLYVNTGGSPKTISVMRPGEPGDAEWTRLGVLSEMSFDRNPIIDSAGQWIAIGRQIYSADLSQRYGELRVAPLSFLPNGPWIVGLGEEGIVITSINDGSVVATIPPPASDSPAGTPEQQRIWLSELMRDVQCAFVDPTAARLIVVSSHNVTSHPLPIDSLPAHPTFVLETPPANEAIVGEPYSCLMQCKIDGVEAEFVRGPDGATVKDNVLQWTPTVANVGKADFEIMLKANGASHKLAWEVFVEPPRLDVPFAAIGCDVNVTGKQAIVWGVDFSNVSADEAIDPTKETRLALVDLTTRKVTAERTVPICVEQAEINATGVYVKPKAVFYQVGNEVPPMQIVRLSKDDLTTTSQTTIQPGYINSLGDKYLDSGTSDSVVRYSLPEIEEVPPLRNHTSHFAKGEIAGRCADGWIFGGVLWDESIENPQLLLAPLGQGVPATQDPFQKDVEFYPVMRGHLLYSVNKDDGINGYSPYSDYPFPPFLPVKLNLLTNSGLTLELLDLQSRQVLREIVVATYRPQRPNDPAPVMKDREYSEWADGLIDTTPELLLVKRNGRILTVPIADGTPTPVPFRIEPKQSTFTLSPSKAERVQYEAKGAKGFRLSVPSLGLEGSSELQSDTGEFTLSVEEHLPQLIAANVGEAQRLNLPNMEYNKRVAAHIRQARQDYRTVFGSPPSGVPVSLEVSVRANGPDLELAGLRHYYIVNVPESVYMKHVPPDPNGGTMAVSTPTASERSRSSRSRPNREPLTSPSALAYSGKFRGEAGEAPATLDLNAAKQEVAALNGRFEAGVIALGSSGGLREWSDTSGKKIQATLVELVGDTAVLSIESGRQFKVPLARFSADDQEWVKANPPSDAAVGRVARVANSMQQIGAALTAHAQRHGSLPPSRLLDERSRPLLSWRVLILRELGYEKLASQFRYDQPWDSPHNKQLVPLMPAVFDNGSSAASEGKTAFVSVIGPAACLSTTRAITLDDIHDPREEALLLVETVDAANVAWTRPIDPADANLAKLIPLLVKHDGGAKVLFADNTVGTAPLDMPVTDWRRLVNINDGAKIGTSIQRGP